MASMSMISIGLLVILASVYCSSVSALPSIKLPPGIFHPITPRVPIFPRPTPRVPIFPRPTPRYPPRFPGPRFGYPPSPPPPIYYYPPTTTTTVEPTFKKAERFGEKLAKKYFGEESINGFRWGYKQGKRFHSVERKCEDFKTVIDSSCPKPKKKASLTPDSSGTVNVHCIVVVTNLGKTSETCLEQYESGEYPKEATCNLDYPKTLGSECLAH